MCAECVQVYIGGFRRVFSGYWGCLKQFLCLNVVIVFFCLFVCKYSNDFLNIELCDIPCDY